MLVVRRNHARRKHNTASPQSTPGERHGRFVGAQGHSPEAALQSLADAGSARNAVAAASTVDCPGAALYVSVSSRRVPSVSSIWTTKADRLLVGVLASSEIPRDGAKCRGGHDHGNDSPPSVAVAADRR